MLKYAMIATFAAVAASTAAYAEENEGCTKAPKAQWLTIGQIESKLKEKGFKVKNVEFDDGCAEAKVTDKDGKAREVRLDPTTADEVKNDD
jgi:hypothetical protein